MRLRRRMQLLFVPFVLLLVIHLGLDSYFVHQRDQVRELVDGRLNPARLALSDLLTGLVDQETGERGYIITGQDTFLDAYGEGGDRVRRKLHTLGRLVAHDADLQAAVLRLRGRIDAWHQLGAKFELDAKTAGRDADVKTLVGTQTGTTLFNEVRAEIAGIQTTLRNALDHREDSLDQLRQRLTNLRALAVVLGLGIVLADGYLLSRWITRPVNALGEAVREVARGQLRHTIPATGPPDLAELGHDVDAMRERLLDVIDEASEAREALASRGMIVLALRDELAHGPLDLHEGLHIAARFQPAEGVVAGDWFDVVDLGGGRLAVALFDVSGHGAEAGVFALKTKYLTLGALRNGMSPAHSLRWLASQLGDTGDHFLTGVIVEIDATAGRLVYASAGHPPVLVSEGASVTALVPTGPLLGPLDATWTEAEARLLPGENLIIYSDGLIEAQGADGAEFGLERLSALVRDAPYGCDPDLVADTCFSELNRMQSGRRHDDVTLVVVSSRSALDGGIGTLDDIGRDLEAELRGDPGVQDESEAGGILHRHL